MSNIIMWIVGGLVAVLLGGYLFLLSIGAGPVNYIDREAHEQFLTDWGSTAITIYPALIREGYAQWFDREAAQQIADFINERGYANATMVDVEPKIETIGHRNEQRVAKASAESFATFVAAEHLDTPYALIGEYMINSRTKKAGAIHYYVVTNEGIVAHAGTINSHYRMFQLIDPSSTEDCTKIVLMHLEESL